MSTARFEVVHTGPYKFHARFVAANNEIVWVTESYRRRRSAMESIVDLCVAVKMDALMSGREVDER